MSNLSSNASYIELLGQIKDKIKHAQIKSYMAVNQQMLLLYWDIGNDIINRQKTAGWGDNVIGQLSKDLKKGFPDTQGFSTRNLKYMRRFAKEYPDFEKGQQVVAQISWSHNMILIQKLKDRQERFWYAQKAIENGWSRSVMVHQIEFGLYERQGKAITNFAAKLPAPQSGMAQQVMKDPYILNFLTLREDFVERELEDAIVQHITKFLLELGKGFAFVGRQYHVDVGGDDFYIDLLFYHLELRCYVAIDLKTKKFKPEYAGKMNFYLSVLDDNLKKEYDNQSIGIILCKDKNNVMAEYALRNINAPIGVSTFELSKAIPEDLQSKLPTIEDLERELKEIEGKDDKEQS